MGSGLLIPSFAQGYADSAAVSDAPNLWRGLVGAWCPFLGPTGVMLRDISGYGNHASFVGGLTPSAWVIDQKGQSLDFPDDDVGVKTGLYVAQPTSLSVAVLVRLDAQPGAHKAFTSYLDVDGWELMVDSSSVFWWAHTKKFAINTTSFTFTLGEYVHIVLTYDETSGTVVYADTAVVDTDGNTGAHTWTPAAKLVVSLGERSDGANDSADCNISQALYYDRALAPSEVQQLYVDPQAFARRRTRVFAAAAAPPSGLSIPIAMRHYMQIMGAG